MQAPESIVLHQRSATLELQFANEKPRELSCELLRVCSPSAEVRGHGEGQEVLQVGKKNVTITAIKPVGNYAVQLVFDDGHDTGLYSWDYLFELCINRDRYWDSYLQRLNAAGASRDPEVQIIKLGL
jgi:DUF971 family protein